MFVTFKVPILFISNDRDGTSPSRFLIPVMWCKLRGAVSCSLMLSDNTLTRRPATFELRDTNFVVRDTVGVLSDPIRMCFHFRQTTNPSGTSHPRRNAIISKSELVISPLGLCSVSRHLFMSGGHSMRHTVGFNSDAPLCHVPPAPSNARRIQISNVVSLATDEFLTVSGPDSNRKN